ncbi:protein of unknown function [Methylocaldum szegediense]|uniref:Transposase n=1 Tax=Methylocaldum szegediense TaxID=73780 RepID=A0ABN8X7H2_9GAMM|nr:protein of unknown function [Methylocaldum szegediense]
MSYTQPQEGKSTSRSEGKRDRYELYAYILHFLLPFSQGCVE